MDLRAVLWQERGIWNGEVEEQKEGIVKEGGKWSTQNVVCS